MSANSHEIVQQMRAEFEDLITTMILPNSLPPLTTDALERDLWKSLLQLGRGLLAAFLVHRAQQVVPEHVCLSETQTLPAHGQSERSYHCVFGKIGFARGYYYRPGQGAFAVDADLNLTCPIPRRPFWSCKPMARASPWSKRPIQAPLCVPAKAPSRARRRRWSPASTLWCPRLTLPRVS